jgi:hypothetical protein
VAGGETGGESPAPDAEAGWVDRARFTEQQQGGDVVLDLFGGSGSTMIAAEKHGHLARVMELDPKYCDVIVRPWQDLTGKVGHLEDGRTFAPWIEATESSLMQRTPSPKPTALKAAEGNPGKHKLNENEPQPLPGVPHVRIISTQ